MIKSFKTMMLWLLLLTVPVQGFAASAMLFCETAHHRADVSLDTHSGHQHHPQAMDHDAMASNDHHTHHAFAGDVDDGDGKFDAHGASKCSACSSCCLGAAIVPTQLAFAAIPPFSSHLAFFPATAFVGHIPARLERPPISFLA